MAPYNEFKPETTSVLFYKPRSHVRYRRQGRRFILWPAYGYRVLAPRVADRKINIFQKATLGMCRAGIGDPEAVADLLHLNSDLVKYIFVELRRDGLISFDSILTNKGHQVLVEEMDELPGEIIVAYVFQDPWTRRLWPRVVERLEYANIELKPGARYPSLVFGSKGKPRVFNPFVKNVDLGGPSATPDARQIFEACRIHRKNKFQLDDPAAGWETDAEDDLYLSPTEAFSIKKIEIISEDPEPFYLTTYIYIPDYELHELEWYVCDPFGIGASSALRRVIEEQSNKDNSLGIYMQRFFQDAIGDVELSDLADNYKVLHDLAINEVNNKLTDIIQLYPYYDHLLSMERAYQELSLFDTNYPEDKMNEILIRAGKVLEGMFRHIQEQHPVENSWRIYSTPDRNYRYAILNEIAEILEFGTPVPPGLANISPKAVKRVAMRGGGTLNERVVTNLLAARCQSDHPLRRVAITQPDLFERVTELSRLRGLSAHDTQTEISQEAVDSQRRNVYQIIKDIIRFDIQSGGNYV